MSKRLRWIVLALVGIVSITWIGFEVREAYRQRRALELCETVYVGDEDRMRDKSKWHCLKYPR